MSDIEQKVIEIEKALGNLREAIRAEKLNPSTTKDSTSDQKEKIYDFNLNF